MTHAEPLVVSSLTWGYPGKPLGHDLSFRLKSHELIAVLGPNGSGKTTLLKTIAGALYSIKGEISVGGKCVRSMSIQERSQRVALLSQSLSPDGALTVRELVALGRTPYLGWWGRTTTNDDLIIETSLSLCGLNSFATTPLAKLSGGEQQRAFVAMTLAQEPMLLLLDEPTTHLDLKWKHELLQFLKALCQKKEIAIVVTLHDPRDALMYAETILLLTSQGPRFFQANDREAFLDELSTTFDVPKTVINY